jgi:hypothetical protein
LLRNNDLILHDCGHLEYKRVDDSRPEPTLESHEDWQAMNCVLDNRVRILSRSLRQNVRALQAPPTPTEVCRWLTTSRA